MMTQSTKLPVVPPGNTNVATEAESRARILLAEDDDEMRSLLVRWLRNAGYDVTACCDGIDLLEQITEFTENHRPLPFGLLISDIRMPWVTGMELLEHMDDFIGFPPIFLITAFGDRAAHESAKQLGAVEIFDKPFDMRDFVEKVNEVFRNRRAPDSKWERG